jgi:hypothetical protein
MEERSKHLTDVLLTYSFVTVPKLKVPKSRQTMDKAFSSKIITVPTITKGEAVDKESKSEDQKL